MKTVALICAMEKEISYIKERFGAVLIDEKNDIYEALLEKVRLIVTVSGIGKVNSAVATQKIIDKYSPDAVINVGIAGGLDRSLSVLDMVIGVDATYHDFSPISLLAEDKRLMTGVFKCDEELLKIAEKACEKLKREGKVKNFVKGRIVSGDSFVEDTEVSKRLFDEMGASCVEMEGASIAQTCKINSIPFLIIRSISDFADNNAEISYETFSTLASNQAGEVMREIIKSL